MAKLTRCTLVTITAVIIPSYCWAQEPASKAIEEVVVTAEKRAEPLQKAPAAITALSGAELANRELQTLVDMTVAFPTAHFEADGYASHLFLRGVGSGQDRITVDPLIGVSMDGVPLPREMQGIGQFDIKDVELLPGPQSTLYGAGAVGGVVIIANHQPVDHDETFASVELGNYGLFHSTLVENKPITANLYARAAVDYTSHSAYETGGAWTGDVLNARLSLLYKPNEDFSALLWTQVVHDRSQPPGATAWSADTTYVNPKNPWDVTSCLSPSCNGIAPRSVFNIGDPYGKTDDFIVAGKLEWRFDGFTISDEPSYLTSRLNVLEYLEEFDAKDQVSHKQVANEIKISSNEIGKLKWLAGIYYLHDLASQDYLLAAPTYSVPRYVFDTIAPYGQLTYSLSDWFRVTGGARYTSTRKATTSLVPGPFPETVGNWRAIDWKAGLEADVAKHSLVYATVQTASAPGTIDASYLVDGRPNLTRTTNLLSFTLGSKNRFLDNRVELNDEAYYYDYRDFLIQTNYPVPCGTSTCFAEGFFNPQKMVIWGNQLDVRVKATPNAELALDVGYNHARTVKFLSPLGINLDHQTPVGSPELTVNLSGQHSFVIGSAGTAILRADSSINSGYYDDFGTTGGCIHCPGMRQHAFSTTGLSLTYYPENKPWTIGVWVRNLENLAQFGGAAYFGTTPAYQGSGFITQPRTFGFRVTFRPN